MTTFVCIDVETANPKFSSICQIGIATYQNGQLVDAWSSYVNPETYFSSINVSIHGIDEDDVRTAPIIPELESKLRELLEGQVCVSHSNFDRSAIDQAFTKYDLTTVTAQWLDSCRVTRRTWEHLRQRGYGLSNVCQELGYEFSHHDALEDAKAAGFVMLSAIEISGRSIQEWVSEQYTKSRSSSSSQVTADGNPDGSLFGSTMVFTGALSMVRKEAAALAADIGCKVTNTVSKKVDYLVVGDQDIDRLSGHEKSSKQRKAEDLIQAGHPIRIIAESDFQHLIKVNASTEG